MQLIAYKTLCLCDFILSAPRSRWSLYPLYRGAKWSRGLNDLLVVLWPATGWVTNQTAQLQILSTLNDHYFFLTCHRFCRVWLAVLHLARFPALNCCLILFLFMVVKMEPKGLPSSKDALSHRDILPAVLNPSRAGALPLQSWDLPALYLPAWQGCWNADQRMTRCCKHRGGFSACLYTACVSALF